MTAPRMIRPNATYAISRRIQGRRFFLRPDAKLTRLFTYVLAVTAAAFDVEVHIATVMSTHYHLVVTVPHQNVSKFMQVLNCRLARGIQVLRRYVGGVVWAPGELSIVELETVEAVIEQIAYAIVNPVKAGLVYRSADWPGLTATVEDIGRRVLSAEHPGYYFTAEKWVESASLPLTMQRWMLELGEEQARAMLAAEVSRQEAEARATIKAERWTVLGPLAAQNVSPYAHAKSREPIGKLVPHIAAGHGQREAREAAIERLSVFRAEYHEALARWVEGDREVVFPAGTYWMRVHHGVNVASFS